MISIETERLMVRAYKEEDRAAVLRFITANKEYLKDVLLDYAFSVNDMDSAGMYIKKSKVGMLTKKIYTLGIWTNSDSTLIGEVVLFNTDWNNKELEIGYYIELGKQRKGYAHEAVSAVLDYIFKNLNIKHVYAQTAKANHPSQKLLLNTGFSMVKETESVYRYSIYGPKS